DTIPAPPFVAPAPFSLVMATGIVSITAFLLGKPLLAHVLFELNVAMYVLLWLLTLRQLVRAPRHLLAGIVDHSAGPGFLAVVAATSVLGGQFVVLAGDTFTGFAFWFAAIVLWAGINYAMLTGFTIKREKPPLDQGIGGGWLLGVVAAQSIAVLGALLAARSA